MNYYNFSNSQYNFLNMKRSSKSSVSGGTVTYKPPSDLFNIAFAKNNRKGKINGKGLNDNLKFIL